MNKALIEKLKELEPTLKERYGIEEFAVFEAREFLIQSLNRPVDIGTFHSMKTFVKNRIRKDFVVAALGWLGSAEKSSKA